LVNFCNEILCYVGHAIKICFVKVEMMV